ncbi:hypothetical protein ACFE04_031550 [Oxalis oulophora]
MLGLSYGELFLLLGATATLIGPKDLPIIARTAGRLAGRAVGYVQVARGQMDSVMQQSQARQVHKELQDTIAQLEAIRYEIRSMSIINPGPMTRRFVDNPDNTSSTTGNTESNNTHEKDIKLDDNSVSGKHHEENRSPAYISKDPNLTSSESSNVFSQATAYARLAEAPGLKSLKSTSDSDEVITESDLDNVLPVSAESAGMLPNKQGNNLYP